MLSGRDAYKKVFVRVSTDGKALVLTLPMSPYMSRSDLAFNTFLLAEQQQQQNVSDTEKRYLKILLKHHPKAAARMDAVAKVKGRSNTSGFFYEQRIPLPRKVHHDFATQESGDDLFTGKKFVEYPDDSIFLHVELVAEVKDNYIPEERMLDPKYMKTVPKTMGAGPMETESTVEGARVLPDHKNETTNNPPATKRAREEPFVETVTEEDDSADDDDGMSQVTNASVAAAAAAAAAAAKAEAQAFAEAARNKVATVLGQAEQHGSSSLQQAAAAGAAEGSLNAEH